MSENLVYMYFFLENKNTINSIVILAKNSLRFLRSRFKVKLQIKAFLVDWDLMRYM